MNAIRRDEIPDNLHSIYVDQWDWEKVILPEDRNVDYLKETVRKIAGVICNTLEELQYYFPQLPGGLSRDITFVTTQELEDRWPHLSPKEREDALLAECRTAFLMQIGGRLRSGERHDGRAPDYDDWTLNGDLLFWDEVLDRSIELSSMGIRVDPAAMDRQLTEAGCDNRRSLTFHKMLLEGKLPLTIGGGIGVFIAYLGFLNAGLITFDSGVPAMANINTPSLWVFLIGLFLAVVLTLKKVKGGILIAIVVTTIVGIPFGVTTTTDTVSFTDALAALPSTFGVIFTSAGLPSLFRPMRSCRAALQAALPSAKESTS